MAEKTIIQKMRKINGSHYILIPKYIVTEGKYAGNDELIITVEKFDEFERAL